MSERETNQETVDRRIYPRIYNAKDLVDSGQLVASTEYYLLRLPEREMVFTPEHVFSLVASTLPELDKSLVRAEDGTELRGYFEQHLRDTEDLRLKDGGIRYGNWVLFEGNGDLVQFCPKEIHELALGAPNSTLLMDPERRLTPTQSREKLRKIIPAVAGMSVGMGIITAIEAVTQAEEGRVCDDKFIGVPNLNRIHGLGYRDIVSPIGMIDPDDGSNGMKRKSNIYIAKSLERNPYFNIRHFPSIDGKNVYDFLRGATVAIDEMDNPLEKINFRRVARELGVRVLGFTDSGSTVRLDVSPFDTNPNDPIAFGHTDEELYRIVAENVGRKGGLFVIAAALIGEDFMNRGDEFGDIISGRLPRQYGSVPQLGSTAMMSGGIAGEIVARMALGWKYPRRVVFDPTGLIINHEGELV